MVMVRRSPLNHSLFVLILSSFRCCSSGDHIFILLFESTTRHEYLTACKRVGTRVPRRCLLSKLKRDICPSPE
jgi:hypothetical protein